MIIQIEQKMNKPFLIVIIVINICSLLKIQKKIKLNKELEVSCKSIKGL
jgi:hypothetical protein